MNYRGQYNSRVVLKECPVCGMDSGVRKVSTTVPEKFFIKCESCGHITRPRNSQSAATLEWNAASNKKKEA